ncbi:translocation/assembly module TamB domain-containing protein [Lyngbya aestuarii]|uniref:translocation/assembly module TamB domain-containing protein n=1 Tax=Lyngbya aestuarii TaxID=118322 RepID=UPI00403DD32C
MTNSPNKTPPDSGADQHRNLMIPLLRWVRRPSTVAVGITTIALGVVGYIGVSVWVNRYLPSWLEAQLGSFLGREVRVGGVESFFLTNIEFGSSSLPATPEDPDKVSLGSIKVSFNPLPLILSGNLPVEITLNNVDAYLEQEETGDWINLDLPEGTPPEITVDTTINLNQGKLVLLPYGESTPLSLTVDGSINSLIFDDNQPLKYDIDAAITSGKVNLKGRTLLKTGESKVSARVQNLPLAQLNPLIPNSLASVKSGELDANLDISVPSFKELPSVLGTAHFQAVEVRSQELLAPVQANTLLRFQGEKVFVEQLRGSYGNVKTAASGIASWQQGIDLAFDVQLLSSANAGKNVPIVLPVAVEGKWQVKLQATTPLSEPTITGSINSQKVTRLDQLNFAQIRAEFAGDSKQLKLTDFLVKPAAGGQITGGGQVKFSSDDEESVNTSTQAPLSLDFQAQLPAEAIAAPYYRFPAGVTLGNITAQAKIRGSLQKPVAFLQWQAPETLVASVGNTPIVGEAVLIDQKIILSNNKVKIGKGNLIAAARGNLKTQEWRASIKANSVSLNPFLPVPAQLAAGKFNFSGELDSLKLSSIRGSGQASLGIGSGTITGEGKLKAGIAEVFATTSQLPLGDLGSPLPITLKTGNIRLSAKLDSLDPEQIQASADARLVVEGGTINATGKLNSGILAVSANASKIALNQIVPDLATPVTLLASQVNLSGNLNSLISSDSTPNLNSLSGSFKGQLATEGGNVNATGNLNSGAFAVQTNAAGIQLAKLIPGFQEPVTLIRSQFNLSGNLDSLISSNSTANLNSLNANFNGLLGVANGSVNTTGKLNNGTLAVKAIASQVQLANLGSTIPARLAGTVNLLGNLEKLLENRNPQALLAQADLQVDVAQGQVDVNGQLNNGQWQTDINASSIDSSLLISQLLPTLNQDREQQQLPALNAKLDLSGNLESPAKQTLATTIRANSVAVQMGEQYLNASGVVLLSDLLKQPDVSSLELNLAAHYNSDTLPLTQLISLLVDDQESLEQINVTGEADFSGRLQGKNLLSAPLAPGNLNLTGDLQLLNFAVNDVVFDPLLAGNVRVNTGQQVALNLQGERDIIAARLEPCTGNRCLVPYLPIAFAIRGGTGGENSLQASGDRQGNILDVTLQNFDLALLNLAPAVDFGIEGPVAGEVTGQLDLNLFTLATTGNVQINQPALGYLKAKQFSGSFSYQDGLAQLSSAVLEFGQSRYELDGGLNLNSGELEGKLVIAQGYVEDILETLGWYSWRELARGLKTPDFANAAVLGTEQVGSSDNSLPQQLRLLASIEQQRANIADIREKVGLPEQLDIEGAFTGEVNLAGTLADPRINFDIQGSDWLWLLEQEVARARNPLEADTEADRVIVVDQVIAQGSFEDGLLTAEPVRLQLDETVISFEGQLSPEQESGTFQLKNLPLKLVRNFVEIPVDLQGKLNATGNLGGSLANPQVTQGEFSFVDAAINCQSQAVPETDDSNCQQLEPILANFSYADSRLEFNTTESSLIQVQATVPYPPTPGVDNQLNLNVELSTDAIALVGPLTQGNIEWVDGQAEIQLAVNGSLDFAQEPVQEIVNNLLANVTGEVTLSNATLKSAAFAEPLTLNGQITLNNQLLQVDNLEGEFQESQLLVTGVLPLFEPIRANDPNLANPLTVSIDQQELNLEGLYEGEVDAQVLITGALLSPVIGGELRLQNGRAFIPKGEDDGDVALVSTTQEKSSSAVSKTGLTIVPKFDDFRVVLGDRFRITKRPVYKFRIAGDLTVNGTLDLAANDNLDKLKNLRPEGTIDIQRGDIDLFSSQFSLVRGYDSKVVFEPNQSILNPNLDIQLGTVVSQPPDRVRLEPPTTEIRDDLVTTVRPEQIKITLSIQGQASQLIRENLGASGNCKFEQESFGSIETSTSSLPSEKLRRLESCIHQAVLGIETDSQFLNTPIVTLTSTPPRNEAEILALLGNQFLTVAKDLERRLEQGQAEELARWAAGRFVIEPALGDVIFTVEEWVTAAGQKVGLTDLQVYPLGIVKGIRVVGEDSLVSVSYDYEFGEIQVRYEMRF